MVKSYFKSKVHCRSAVRFGRDSADYLIYCAPLVCVPDVIGGLAVWWHYKPKTKQVWNHVNWRLLGSNPARNPQTPIAIPLDETNNTWRIFFVRTAVHHVCDHTSWHRPKSSPKIDPTTGITPGTPYSAFMLAHMPRRQNEYQYGNRTHDHRNKTLAISQQS